MYSLSIPDVDVDVISLAHHWILWQWMSVIRKVQTEWKWDSKAFLNYINSFVQLNKESSINNINCFQWKCNSVWIRREIFTDQAQSKTVLHKYVGGFWRERTTGDGLFTKGGIIMDSYFVKV